MRTLTGIVLCGGQSSRMKHDKGLIVTHKLSWAEAARQKLLVHCSEAYISINKKQAEKYREIFRPAVLVPDDEEGNSPYQGPLLGLLSIHKKYPQHDLLLLACDMAGMQQAPLQLLVNAYCENEGYDGYAFICEDVFEPMCAIYTTSVLQRLSSLPEKDKVHHSLQKMLQQSHSFTLRLVPSLRPSFKNYNEQKDLSTLSG